MDSIEAIQEQEQILADRAAMERDGAAAPSIGTPAPAYVRGTHPDTDVAVTFVPGELLPDWAVTALADSSSTYDADNRVWTLRGTPAAPAKRGTRGARGGAGQPAR